MLDQGLHDIRPGIYRGHIDYLLGFALDDGWWRDLNFIRYAICRRVVRDCLIISSGTRIEWRLRRKRMHRRRIRRHLTHQFVRLERDVGSLSSVKFVEVEHGRVPPLPPNLGRAL